MCLSVTALAATVFVSTCNQRHLRHYYRLFLDFNSWIFGKAFRSKFMACKSQFANELELAASRFPRSFGTNETQQLREGQLVGLMLLQRLATGATGVKQARYRQWAYSGSEALVRACTVANIQCLYMNSAEGFRSQDIHRRSNGNRWGDNHPSLLR